jgi:hypothetical protein
VDASADYDQADLATCSAAVHKRTVIVEEDVYKVLAAQQSQRIRHICELEYMRGRCSLVLELMLLWSYA